VCALAPRDAGLVGGLLDLARDGVGDALVEDRGDDVFGVQLVVRDDEQGRLQARQSALSGGSRRGRGVSYNSGGLRQSLMNASRRRKEGGLMGATVLTVDLPGNVSEDEVKLLLAVKLYEVGRVSLGQAAKLAGFSKRAFMEMLGRHQVPVFNYSPEELRQEFGA
jgi:predicted HTH domain antitoxin